MTLIIFVDRFTKPIDSATPICENTWHLPLTRYQTFCFNLKCTIRHGLRRALYRPNANGSCTVLRSIVLFKMVFHSTRFDDQACATSFPLQCLATKDHIEKPCVGRQRFYTVTIRLLFVQSYQTSVPSLSRLISGEARVDNISSVLLHMYLHMDTNPCQSSSVADASTANTWELRSSVTFNTNSIVSVSRTSKSSGSRRTAVAI